MATTIYALCEPDLQIPVIRYIGKTTNLKTRFRDHLSKSSRLSNHLGCWLRSLQNRKEKPVLMELTEVPDEIGSAAEILYIRLAREGGMDLVNATDGGEGVNNPSTESRRKSSEAKIGDKNPMYGKPVSQEHREKISEALRGPKSVWFGRTHSEETKKKLSELNKGENHPLYGQRGEACHNFGRTHSEEAKAKMSEAHSGSKNAFYGREHTEETKARLSVLATKRMTGLYRGPYKPLARLPLFSNGGGI